VGGDQGNKESKGGELRKKTRGGKKGRKPIKTRGRERWPSCERKGRKKKGKVGGPGGSRRNL